MKLTEKTGRLLCWYLPDWVDGLSMLNWLGTCRQAHLSQHGTSWSAKLQATMGFAKGLAAYMRKHRVMPSDDDYLETVLRLLHDDRLPLTLPSPGGPVVINNAHIGKFRDHIALYLGLRTGRIKGNSFEEFFEVVQKLNSQEHAWCRDPAFQSVCNQLVDGNARFFVRSGCWESLLRGSECTDSCDCIYLVFQYHNFYFALCTWPDIDTLL